MIDTIIGAAIGAVISILIAQLYHRRASAALQQEIETLKSSNDTMHQSIKDLDDLASKIREDTEITKRHTVAGTPDDSEYPYK